MVRLPHSFIILRLKLLCFVNSARTGWSVAEGQRVLCGVESSCSLQLCVQAERGSLLCILGQNGAGKTTTIKILTGMVDSISDKRLLVANDVITKVKATSGQATIFGRDVASEMNEIRAMIGCCPQFDLLWPRLTV